MGFMAFTYVWLGYTQHAYTPVIQIASITGTYGVSWLIVAVNGAVAMWVVFLLPRSSRESRLEESRIPGWGIWTTTATAILSLIMTVAYGMISISDPVAGESIRVSVVQGNIAQDEKWDPEYAESILRTYTDLTHEVSKEHPDLIVWPEAATPGAISLDEKMYSRVREIANRTGANLLLGSTSHQKFKDDPGKRIRYYNSAFLIDPRESVKPQRYDKIRLLPFGEYLPYKEAVPWEQIGVPEVGTTLRGTEFKVFQGPSYRFSAPICWENIFPNLPRRFVAQGAQFIVNITNEAWFGKSAGPVHYLVSSIFRAVENRVYVVRCANTGISCFIDPYGRVTSKVESSEGEDIFVRGIATQNILPLNSRTIYNRYGDWLAWLCIAVSLGCLVVAVIQHRIRTVQ